jgi:signal transduction histidine kinase
MDNADSDRIRQVCNTLLEQIDQLSFIASEFSNFAKMPRAENEPLKIADVIMNMRELYENDEVEMQFTGLDADVMVYADKKQLSRVFQNLLKNAIESIPEERDGNIEISIDVVKHKDQPMASVSISDNGIGMDAAHLQRIFEPNFTTKTTGTGLGLPISKKIIELAGGTIEVTSEVGEGSTFVVLIPVYEP